MQTNWVVLTGAPSAGKTTVVQALAELGYSTQTEVARGYISEQLALGRSLQEICDDRPGLQEILFQRSLNIEGNLDPHHPHILDRSMIDTVGYCLFYGIPIEPFVRRIPPQRYRIVLLFDPLPFQPDAVRVEDAEMALRAGLYMERAYRDVGYSPIRVPIMSVPERTDFVLDHLKRLEPSSVRLSSMAAA